MSSAQCAKKTFVPRCCGERARVVRPMLSNRLAEESAAQLAERGVPFVVEPSEALARAEGLLMEFVALLVAGRRLRDIGNEQVEERTAQLARSREPSYRSSSTRVPLPGRRALVRCCLMRARLYVCIWASNRSTIICRV
jgi:hypothetical protein